MESCAPFIAAYRDEAGGPFIAAYRDERAGGAGSHK
jgi:hypothetical protein